MIFDNDERIKNKNITQNFYNIDMNFQNEEINFVKFFKGEENVLTYITSTPFKHFFEGTFKNDDKEIKYILKVIPYLNSSTPQNNIRCPERPENSEIIIHNLLFELLKTKSLLNIMIPYLSFMTNIAPFVNSDMNEIVGKNNEKYMIFIDKYSQKKFNDKVKILIIEHGENLKTFLLKNKNSFNNSAWQMLLFQIILTLAIIQEKYPSFRHNSLGINNIYITKNNDINQINNFKYIEFDGQEFIFENGEYNFMISNFSLSTINNLVNNTRTDNPFIKQLGISNIQNRYYDLHFFLSNILYISARNSIDLPFEITDFILRIIPQKYRQNTEKYNRIIIDEEFITPKEIIKHDPLFSLFRKKKNLDIFNDAFIEI